MIADPAIVAMNSRHLIASPVEGQGFVPFQPKAFAVRPVMSVPGQNEELTVGKSGPLRPTRRTSSRPVGPALMDQQAVFTT